MRTKRTVFILISGKASTGKTTLGNYLSARLGEIEGLSVFNTAFAAPIKYIAKTVFGWDGKKDARGRRLLQVIGTEAGREYDENIWVRKTVNNVFESHMFPPNFVIIDDWRFPNECTYIQDQKVHDVFTIRVEAPNRESLKGTPEENHPSEVSLPKYNDDLLYDFVVDNEKDFNDLYRQADEIISYLTEHFIHE